MKILKWILLSFLVMPTAFADNHVKSKIAFVGEIQSWLSGQKKRLETQFPIVGKVVIITRVDQGVEWIVNTDRKMYQEKPIALPHFSSACAA